MVSYEEIGERQQVRKLLTSRHIIGQERVIAFWKGSVWCHFGQGWCCKCPSVTRGNRSAKIKTFSTRRRGNRGWKREARRAKSIRSRRGVSLLWAGRGSARRGARLRRPLAREGWRVIPPSLCLVWSLDHWQSWGEGVGEGKSGSKETAQVSGRLDAASLEA